LAKRAAYLNDNPQQRLEAPRAANLFWSASYEKGHPHPRQTRQHSRAGRGRLSNAEIAAQLGCTAGTLKVRCSKFGISLRRPAELKPPKLPKSPKSLRLRALSERATATLRQCALARGLSSAKLASDLLEVIATDDLFDAVLDHEPA